MLAAPFVTAVQAGDYVRYDVARGTPDRNYPKRIDRGTWPGLWTSRISAAVDWGNGKSYFFSGSQYIRYDNRADRADRGYPKNVDDSTWPGLSALGPVTAAVNWGNGKIYFFNGLWYSRFDVAKNRVDRGYPKRVDDSTWPGLSALGPITAAVNWGNGKVYFFSDTWYSRFDVASNRTDRGYPYAVDNEYWPGLVSRSGIGSAINWRNGKSYFFFK